MRLLVFFLRYFRAYTGWAGVAVVAAMLYGISAAAVIALMEPIFSDLLLAEGGAPIKLEAQPESRREGPGSDPEDGLLESVESWSDRVNLKDWLDRGYERLRRSAGVSEEGIVYFLPLLLAVIFLIRGMASFVSAFCFRRIGLGMTNDIRNDLYRRILEQSSRFHAQHSSGELTSRIVSDISLMQIAVSDRLLDLVRQSMSLFFLVALLLSIHLRLAILCLVVTPLFLLPIVRFGRGMRRTSLRSQERMADLASLVGEGSRGHQVVKAFGMEEFEYDRFRLAASKHLRVNLRAQMLASMSSPVLESLAAVGAVALLIFAALQIRAGQLSAPLFVTFLLNLFWMYEPVRKLNRVNLVLQQSLAAAQRVLGLMEEPNEIHEVPSPIHLEGLTRRIFFEDVHFAYEDQEVLRGIDLEVRRGEVVALVGPSGSGKSTLLNLLPRFFDPDAGRVTIDDIDISRASLESLRSLIGIVTQETILFDDTIRNNIAYGHHELPLDELREAAAAAYADEFVMQLPRGYETRVGEAGLRLSGGERQRLAVARALAKNAPILILDEATSHLDSESEALVQKALYNLMRGRTTLVIAHRLSTVMKADRIVVLEAGKIVEAGDHRELLALGGIYKRLYDLQFQE
jgi:subfamily B ATP-binding cassette protein MsbA